MSRTNDVRWKEVKFFIFVFCFSLFSPQFGFFFNYFSFSVSPCGMWDFSSLARD